MKKLGTYLLVIALTCIVQLSFGQGMGVNTTGAAADASAIIDASSTSQGVLVPRMTAAQKTAIASPATGLMIFQMDGTAGFYYYPGSGWSAVGGGGGGSLPSGTDGQLLQLVGGVPTWVNVAPTVTTNAVSIINVGNATCGGNVTLEGQATVTARGICWGTSPNPTIALSTKTVDGSGTGSYTSSITQLLPTTTYYVRAYATNVFNTVYGSNVSFTTGTVAIGDNYGGGKVAYLLVSGDPGYSATTQHGLVAPPSDQSTSMKWTNGAIISITGATGSAIGTGQSNTNAIIANLGVGTYAASICDNLVLGGFSDWFLPSSGELSKLYLNRVAIGGFTTGTYWSSRETLDSHADGVYFVNGTSDVNNKQYTTYVRAVRSF